MARDNSNRSALNQAFFAVLGAIGTSLGVLGFVAFVGGSVWLARYRGAHFSGTYTVGLLPRSELIATGADQLYAPAIVAAIAVGVGAAAFFVCRHFGSKHWIWVTVVSLAGAAGFTFAAAYYFWHETGNDDLIGPTLFAVLTALSFLGLVGWRARVPTERIWRRLAWIVLVAVVLAAVDRHYFLQIEEPENYINVRTSFAAAMTVLILGGAVVSWLAWRAYDDRPGAKVAVGRLAAFLGALLITVLAYGALETYARNLVRPDVRPAAILRESSPDLAGIYVGQDSDSISIGILNPRLQRAGEPEAGPRASARVVTIPRSDVTAFAVGGTIEVESAEGLAPCLLISLQRLEGEPSAPTC